MRTQILLILLIINFTAVFGQNKDNSFVGKWVTEPDRNGMINFISLNENGTGITGPGRYSNGKIELSKFMKSELQNWEIEKDTLKLTTNPIPRGKDKEPKSMILTYIILEKKKDVFSAYYSDLEMDKMMKEAGEEVVPIKLIFKKTE